MNKQELIQDDRLRGVFDVKIKSPTILCVMRIPPSLSGHGGSQRAWRLVEALSAIGTVHFVLISRKSDRDAASVSLTPLGAITKSITSIDIPEWEPSTREQVFSLPRVNTGWLDLLRMKTHEAPVISRAGLQQIAEQLPIRSADLIFAGRLPSATIMQSLIDQGYLTARARVVDFDDIMSRFRERQGQFDATLGRQGRIIARIDTRFIRQAERRIATSWQGISVCTNEDVDSLRAAYPDAHVVKVPNVIERPYLPARPADGTIRLLFVGALNFPPNIQGLRAFLTEAWPIIRSAHKNVTFTIVGLYPGEDAKKLAAQHDVFLHGDVPSVQPYYENADVVLAPILFGSGTRIKIMEAMAYGRPVVSTPMGAEGLHLISGQHLMIADTMQAFADATIALAQDRQLRLHLAAAARRFVAQEYGVLKLSAAINVLIDREACGH